jgi:hypothetical protein
MPTVRLRDAAEYSAPPGSPSSCRKRGSARSRRQPRPAFAWLAGTRVTADEWLW